MQTLTPCKRVPIFGRSVRIGILSLAVAAFAIGSTFYFESDPVGLISINIIPGVILVFQIYKIIDDVLSLNNTKYLLDEHGLSVTNERSQTKITYRPSEVSNIRIFRVPFGYKLIIPDERMRIEKDHRILGVRVGTAPDDYYVEEKRVIFVCNKAQAERIKSFFLDSGV